MINQVSPTQPRRARLLTVASYCALTLLFAGAPAWLIDRWAGSNLTRLWAQACATLAGVLLLGVAIRLRSPHFAHRVLMLTGGLLLLAAVLDSLDGQQDALPTVVVLWGAFALEFAGITIQLVLAERPHNGRWWIAVMFGTALALVYVGAATYYAFVNAMLAPVRVESHPLNGIGILLSQMLLWVGELGRWASVLRGHIRLCPSCGLRNIRERRTCKRCHAALGPVEYVE